MLWMLNTKEAYYDSILMKMDSSAYDLTIFVSIYLNTILKQNALIGKQIDWFRTKSNKHFELYPYIWTIFDF